MDSSDSPSIHKRSHVPHFLSIIRNSLFDYTEIITELQSILDSSSSTPIMSNQPSSGIGSSSKQVPELTSVAADPSHLLQSSDFTPHHSRRPSLEIKLVRLYNEFNENHDLHIRSYRRAYQLEREKLDSKVKKLFEDFDTAESFFSSGQIIQARQIPETPTRRLEMPTNPQDEQLNSSPEIRLSGDTRSGQGPFRGFGANTPSQDPRTPQNH